MCISARAFKIQMRSNEYLLAKVGFDRAENEPSKVWPPDRSAGLVLPDPGEVGGRAGLADVLADVCGGSGFKKRREGGLQKGVLRERNIKNIKVERTDRRNS